MLCIWKLGIVFLLSFMLTWEEVKQKNCNLEISFLEKMFFVGAGPEGVSNKV